MPVGGAEPRNQCVRNADLESEAFAGFHSLHHLLDPRLFGLITLGVADGEEDSPVHLRPVLSRGAACEPRTVAG